MTPDNITLDKAAIQLGLYYTELMDALDEVFVKDYADSPGHDHQPILLPLSELDKYPDTEIPYDYFLQIQAYLKIEELPNSDLRGDLSPAVFGRRMNYLKRIREWSLNWQAQNKTEYKKWYKANKGYNEREGFKLPPSFDIMFYWLYAHFANEKGSRPEYYLTRPFQEEYFEQYHYAHIRPKDEISPPVKESHDKESINLFKHKNIRIGHWVFYWYYLTKYEWLKRVDEINCPYLVKWGKERDISGRTIFQDLSGLKVSNDPNKLMQGKYGKELMLEAILLLNKNEFPKAAAAAQKAYNDFVKKRI